LAGSPQPYSDENSRGKVQNVVTDTTVEPDASVMRETLEEYLGL
jgi:hypothetical protein